MRKISAFLQLIRWQNIVFIAIAQLLFHYCIIVPNFFRANTEPLITNTYLVIIILASMFIAAGGNVINDYFDLNIDKINKPNKLVIEKYISRRNAIFIHLFLSLLGIMCTVYVAHYKNLFWLNVANASAVLLLFIYSASLKKKFIVGNIVVSALTAWVILILTIPEFQRLSINNLTIDAAEKIFRLGMLYASFSFIISVVREVIKDMEDIEGDRRNGCRTLPIVLGLNATKVFVSVWLIVLIGLLVVAQLYVVKYGWWLSIAYSIVVLIVPLIVVLKKMFKANTSTEFHQLSSYVKWIMLAGILSMIFFRILD